MFPFPLDRFQSDALDALCNDSSVVLSAPTGAGKTVVGEMAVYLALCRSRRVFYTTPLKALSNQKFYDFKQLFGASRVGLLTGDVTVNRDADIIVMTTEVYRNMLYMDAAEARAGPPVTDNLHAVVFDEFHYLNDRDRGTVWEESVINSPPHVLLVALSATMSNAYDVRDWFAGVQGPTVLVQSDVRPVPLKFGYCDQEGLTPLFDAGADATQAKRKGFGRRSKRSKEDKKEGPRMHPKLLRKLNERADSMSGGKSSGGRRGGKDGKSSDPKELGDRFKDIARRNNRRRGSMAEVPSFQFVVRNLRRRDMLPCIVFIFSRAGCDRAASLASNEREELVTEDEREKIRQRLDAFLAENADAVQEERIDLALKGIASHHAGLLPLWKLCVEELFQDGLIKVVFATETLAAGINMPARTTVISTLSKRAGEEGIRSLTTSEVLQMAGRAGRRGKDVVGHSLVLRSRYEGALDAFKVLTADVDALESKFTPTYGMVLNLLLTRSLADAKRLVDRSFGNFLREKARFRAQETKTNYLPEADVEGLRREKEALQSVLADAQSIVAQVDEKELQSFLKSLERVKAERRALSYLIQQSAEMDSELIEDTLTFAPSGTRLLLREKITVSPGAEKRQKRRDYHAAITAAAEGDLGKELRVFYLSADSDELEEMKDEEAIAEQVVEAVLIDIHSEAINTAPTFAGVDAHGQLRLFQHTAVTRIVYDEDTIDVDSLAPDWAETGLPNKSSWRSLTHDQYVAPLPNTLNAVVKAVKTWREERNAGSGTPDRDDAKVEQDKRDLPEILAQKNRVERAKALVLEQTLVQREDVDAGILVAARRAINKIVGTLSGSSDPTGGKRKRRRERGAKGRYAALANEDDGNSGTEGGSGDYENSSWDDFMGLVGVLQHYGFVDDSYSVTSLGELGAKVRSENELWTSVVLMEPDLGHVSPVHLGAVVGATQMEGGRADSFVDWEISTEVREAVGELAAVRTRMMAVQAEFEADVGIGLDAELMGVVEMWATGVTWVELLRATSLQEGDVVRVIRRTLDVLRQIQHLPLVSMELKRNARRAVTLLDRFPVTDDRTYVVGEHERASDMPVVGGGEGGRGMTGSGMTENGMAGNGMAGNGM